VHLHESLYGGLKRDFSKNASLGNSKKKTMKTFANNCLRKSVWLNTLSSGKHSFELHGEVKIRSAELQETFMVFNQRSLLLIIQLLKLTAISNHKIFFHILYLVCCKMLCSINLSQTVFTPVPTKAYSQLNTALQHTGIYATKENLYRSVLKNPSYLLQNQTFF